jgi:hypothetical protein
MLIPLYAYSSICLFLYMLIYASFLAGGCEGNHHGKMCSSDSSKRWSAYPQLENKLTRLHLLSFVLLVLQTEIHKCFSTDTSRPIHTNQHLHFLFSPPERLFFAHPIVLLLLLLLLLLLSICRPKKV